MKTYRRMAYRYPEVMVPLRDSEGEIVRDEKDRPILMRKPQSPTRLARPTDFNTWLEEESRDEELPLTYQLRHARERAIIDGN